MCQHSKLRVRIIENPIIYYYTYVRLGTAWNFNYKYYVRICIKCFLNTYTCVRVCANWNICLKTYARKVYHEYN